MRVRRNASFTVALAAALSLLAAGPASAARAEQAAAPAPDAVALQWYDITSQTVGAAAFPEAITQSRTWAVSWLAAARAAGAGNSPGFTTAAFAQALHDTLAAQVPAQQAQLDADLTATLAGVPDGAAKQAGIAAGRRAASTVLAERQGDGTDTASLDIPYTPPPPGPGIWQPTPPTFGPAVRAGQGNARPFLFARGSQFDPGPPPSLSSPAYLSALAEVRAYGSADSTARTPAQTDIAQFWYPALNFAYGQILRAVLAGPAHPLRWDATLVATFHAITTDAQIAIYNAKFEYAFWRPVTAIQDGGVQPDPAWTPQSVTPRYPEYPSGHGGYAGAAQQVLTAFLGPDAPAPIALTSPNDPGVTRTYTNWATITHEVIDARVWEGVHFRFSDITGVREGEQVARYDLDRLLRLLS
ncbi:MAG TPA: vanadium-dependent haloperoxidase [Streptosporangiaceae bacterium]